MILVAFVIAEQTAEGTAKSASTLFSLLLKVVKNAASGIFCLL